MVWPTKLAFVALTLVNLALVLCGAWLALWTPVLFERERPQDQVMVVAMAIGIVAFPVVALICAILPWLFLRVRWRGVALATAILPVAILVSFYALLRLAMVLGA
jgi:hypothetical protein